MSRYRQLLPRLESTASRHPVEDGCKCGANSPDRRRGRQGRHRCRTCQPASAAKITVAWSVLGRLERPRPIRARCRTCPAKLRQAVSRRAADVQGPQGDASSSGMARWAAECGLRLQAWTRLSRPVGAADARRAEPESSEKPLHVSNHWRQYPGRRQGLAQSSRTGSILRSRAAWLSVSAMVTQDRVADQIVRRQGASWAKPGRRFVHDHRADHPKPCNRPRSPYVDPVTSSRTIPDSRRDLADDCGSGGILKVSGRAGNSVGCARCHRQPLRAR
jgi:hypothetical protein